MIPVKRTLIGMAARAMLTYNGLLPARRPDISWRTYVAAGGPVSGKR